MAMHASATWPARRGLNSNPLLAPHERMDLGCGDENRKGRSVPLADEISTFHKVNRVSGVIRVLRQAPIFTGLESTNQVGQGSNGWNSDADLVASLQGKRVWRHDTGSRQQKASVWKAVLTVKVFDQLHGISLQLL